jgi:hypothetical protein
MEFIFSPILLGMLFLAVPGVRLAVDAFQRSQQKSATLASFFGATLGILLLAFVTPHAFFFNRTVVTGNLLVGLTAAHLAIGFFGCVLGARSRSIQDNRFRVPAAALLMSAALFPIAWFTLTGPLLRLFSVERLE